MPETTDDPTPIEPGDRFLVGEKPATLLRVRDVIESDGREMARMEIGRRDPIPYQTPVADVRRHVDKGRYSRVESR